MQFHPESVDWKPTPVLERLDHVLGLVPPSPGHYPPLRTQLPSPSDILTMAPTSQFLLPMSFQYADYHLRPLINKLYITDPPNQKLLPNAGSLHLHHLSHLGRDRILAEAAERGVPDTFGHTSQTAWIITSFGVCWVVIPKAT